MNHRKTSQDGPITHFHMARQLRAVGEDGVAANLTIMGQMDVCHDPVVIPYAGCAFVMDGSNVEGAKFADRVSMANDQFTWFTVVFFVLRNRAQRVELKMVLSLPMVVRPSITQCDPMLVRAPMRTCGPIVVNGPTRTDGSNSALGSTIAVG